MVHRRLQAAALELVASHSNVLCVVLFGSLARGQATAYSDADVCVLLRSHPQKRWFDRIEEFASAFEHVGVGVDLFPYTVEEFTEGLQRPGFFRQILCEGLVLAGSLPPGLKETAERVQTTTDRHR